MVGILLKKEDIGCVLGCNTVHNDDDDDGDDVVVVVVVKMYVLMMSYSE